MRAALSLTVATTVFVISFLVSTIYDTLFNGIFICLIQIGQEFGNELVERWFSCFGISCTFPREALLQCRPVARGMFALPTPSRGPKGPHFGLKVQHLE